MIARASALAASTAALFVLASPAAALRPDTPGTTELFRYDATDVVESHPSPGGAFAIHFTRAGTNSVPLFDGDGSGVPDHVERVAVIYDEVLAFYQGELGFRQPLGDGSIVDAGGDARFDVYLLDFGGSADGAFRVDACGVGGATASQCFGYMVQENDFSGYGYPTVDYANRLLASHELFHAVQAAYDAEEGSVLSEGTAVWASEAFDETLRDLEGFADGYLDHTDRPIDRPLPGPIDPFSYGSGIFFRFLEERFGRDVIRALWEACETDAWLPALDDLLTRDHGASFAAAFGEFVVWNLFTAERADPAQGYANGELFPSVAISPVTLPHRAGPLRVFYASAQYFAADPGTRTAITAALVGDAAGLDLVIAVRRGTALEIASGASADVSGADEVIVIVRSPEREGESRRPGLCIGNPAEVEGCRRALEAMPDGGLPMDDAGVALDDAGTMPPVEGGGGCACTAVGARHSAGAGALRWPGAGALALLGLVALSALRRSRRRT